MTRTPPYDQEAEAAVLGSILLNNRVFGPVAAIVGPADFYSEKHRRIFSAISDLIEKGPVDVVTLGGALREAGYLKKIGGAVALSTLADGVATSAHAEHYAKIVREKSARRAVILAAEQIAASGYAEDQGLDDYIAESRGAIIEAGRALAVKGGLAPFFDGMTGIIKMLETGGKPKGLIKTGFLKLDRAIAGFWPGLLTVIGGRPGMGKSTFALNFALNSALRNEKGAIFTLEDARLSQQYRALGRLADLNIQKLRLGEVRGEEFPPIMAALLRIEQMKGLYMSDRAMSIRQIEQAAASHKSTNGLDWIIVDHLGYVAEQGKEYEINSRTARAMAVLAKELEIPVILIAQLHRESEKAKAEPRLKDLRGSGRIEEDARTVLFVHRPWEYCDRTKPDNQRLKNQMTMIVAKQNHGPTGAIHLKCDLSRAWVGDRDDSGETEAY